MSADTAIDDENPEDDEIARQILILAGLETPDDEYEEEEDGIVESWRVNSEALEETAEILVVGSKVFAWEIVKAWMKHNRNMLNETYTLAERRKINRFLDKIIDDFDKYMDEYRKRK